MSQSLNVQQNDPTELLEVFDSAGQPTGVARPRREIHLRGDWHQAFHCWILRGEGGQVVLQRRSLQKDTFAGLWDAAAAGHWRFGESAAEAAREITEELGIRVRFEGLSFRGRERVSRRFPNGLIDREFHQVYVLFDDRPFDAYQPDPAEVIGLAAFPVHDLIDLAAGKRRSIAATASTVGELQLTRETFVPYSAARLRRNLGGAWRVDRL